MTRKLALIFLFAGSTAAVAQDEVRVPIALDPQQVVRTIVGGFERVDLTGGPHPVHRPETRAGAPDLPALRLRVALPPGARPLRPRLEVRRRVALAGVCRPCPADTPRPLERDDWRRRQVPPAAPDPRLYASRETYPRDPAVLAGTGVLGDAAIALVDVVPFELVLDLGALTLLADVELVVPYARLAARGGAALAPAPASDEVLRALVANPAQLATCRPAPAPPEATLVILTDDHAWTQGERGPWQRGRYLGPITDAFQPLAADHTALGTSARVVRVSDVVNGVHGDFTRNAAGLPARDLAEVLRNFVQGCAYPRWGTRYLLVGGDVEIVPTRHVLDPWMDWRTATGDWTASDPWNALSAICRSWWPGAAATATASPASPGVERLIDGDAATGWAPPALPLPAPDVRRQAAPATPVGARPPVAPRALTVDLDLSWPNALWPAYNRVQLTWDAPPSAWKAITVWSSRDQGQTWRSQGAWPAGQDEMAFGQGQWLELAGAPSLRLRLAFPEGWPQGRRLMEVSMFGVTSAAYAVAPDARLLVGAGLTPEVPVLFRGAAGFAPDFVRHTDHGGSAASGWSYVTSPGSTVAVAGPTPYVLVRAAPGWVGPQATRWARGVTPVYYAADSYLGDVAGDAYVGGAAFDAATPWHDFDQSGDGWCARDGDGIDGVHEVGVGRAPVRSAAEAERFVRRTRTYLRYRDVVTGQGLGDFARRGLLGAKALWSATAGDEGYTSRATMAAVWQAQDPSAWIERFFEHEGFFGGAQPLAGLVPAFSQGWNRVAILSHSGPDYACEFTPQNVALTTNAPSYGVVFTYGCSPGAFDLPTDSVSEAFLLAPQGGACAFVGNSRYGWGGDHVIEEGFWRQASATPRLGDALHARELRSLDAPWLRMNLLGDPALPMWTRLPAPLLVRATRGAAGAHTVRVTTSRGHPVEGALVAITARGRLVDRALTDAQGSARVTAPDGATLGVSAVSTPATPDRAFVPVIRPLSEVVVAVLHDGVARD